MFCHKCGKKTLETAKFCPFCGAETARRKSSVAKTIESTQVGQGRTDNSNVKYITPRKERKTHRFGLVLTILIICIGGFLFLWNSQGLFGNKTTFTNKEIRQIQSVDVELDRLQQESNFSYNESIDDRKEMAMNVLYDLERQSLITSNSIIYDPESDIISFEYSPGVLGAIILKPFDEGRNSNNNSRTDSVDRPDISVREGNSDPDVLVLNAFEDKPFRTDYYKSLCVEWKSSGIDTIVDYYVTVEDLKHLKGHDVIVFSGHGSYYTSININAPVLWLNEKAISDADLKYSVDLKGQRIGRGSTSDGIVYFVLPGFIDNHYKTGDLKGSILFSESCEFMGKNGNVVEQWTESLTQASLESFIGFHNSVMAVYCRNMMKTFVELYWSGYSTEAAFHDVKQLYGADDGSIPAYPLLRGNGKTMIETTQLSESAPTSSPESTPAIEPDDIEFTTQYDFGGVASIIDKDGYTYDITYEINNPIVTVDETLGKPGEVGFTVIPASGRATITNTTLGKQAPNFFVCFFPVALSSSIAPVSEALRIEEEWNNFTSDSNDDNWNYYNYGFYEEHLQIQTLNSRVEYNIISQCSSGKLLLFSYDPSGGSGMSNTMMTVDESVSALVLNPYANMGHSGKELFSPAEVASQISDILSNPAGWILVSGTVAGQEGIPRAGFLPREDTVLCNIPGSWGGHGQVIYIDD